MTTIRHWISGTETAGISTRANSVYDPAAGAATGEVILAEPADVESAIMFD